MSLYKRFPLYLFLQIVGMFAPVFISHLVYGSQDWSESTLNVSIILGSQAVLDILCALIVTRLRFTVRILIGLLMMFLRSLVFVGLMSYAYQYIILDKVYNYYKPFLLWIPISLIIWEVTYLLTKKRNHNSPTTAKPNA